jgi:hypothetical protein
MYLYYIAVSTAQSPMPKNASIDGCKCELPPVAATIETLAEPDGPLPKPFIPPLIYPPIPVVAFPITTGLPEGGYDKITPFVVITSPGVSVSTGDPFFSITTAPPFGPYDATIPCVVNTSPGVRTSAGVGFWSPTTGLPEGGYDKTTPFVVITCPGVIVCTGDPPFSITRLPPPLVAKDPTIPCVVNCSPGVSVSTGVGFGFWFVC